MNSMVNVKKIENKDRVIFIIMLILYFTIQLNADWTNNFYLIHGIQMAVIVFCVIKKRYIRMDFPVKILLLYYMFFIISSAWSADMRQSFVFVIYIMAMFFPVLLIANYADDFDKFLLVIKAFVIASGINGIYLIITAGWFTYIGNTTDGLYYWAANTTSKHYAIAMVFLLLVIKFEDKKIWRLSGVLLVLEFSYILVFCASRGALLLIFASLLMAFITKKEAIAKKLFKIVIFILLVVLIYYLFMNVSILYAAIGKRFDSFNSALSKGGLIGAESERIGLINAGMELIMDRPILGYGFNGFIEYTSYGARNLYSHNDYIECVVELGIVGGLIYYSLYAWMVTKTNKLCKKTNGVDFSLLVGCFFGIVVFNMVSITRYDFATMVFIMVFVMAVRMRKLVEGDRKGDGKERFVY